MYIFRYEVFIVTNLQSQQIHVSQSTNHEYTSIHDSTVHCMYRQSQLHMVIRKDLFPARIITYTNQFLQINTSTNNGSYFIIHVHVALPKT